MTTIAAIFPRPEVRPHDEKTGRWKKLNKKKENN